MTFIVCGGAGFVGSHFVDLLYGKGHKVVVVDKLTYAGNRTNIPPAVQFAQRDINDRVFMQTLLTEVKPHAVFNFAAESHVCRSISEPEAFIRSNICGTFALLQEVLRYEQVAPAGFRFIQVSTDEVFGDLGPYDPPFTEKSPFLPHSPYSASKAAADHLISAWSHTYDLPVITTHCTNNYGPRQYPEKLIPLAIACFLAGKPFALHGDGSNVRDWMWVEDHCRGIWAAYERGLPGQRYCFGGHAERSNLAVVTQIAQQLGRPDLITFGPDRPGNDRRYAVNFARARSELQWEPQANFETYLSRTVTWYAQNQQWLARCAEAVTA